MAEPDEDRDSETYAAELRDQGREDFYKGDYKRAYSRFMGSVLSDAIRWFREEGVNFSRPPGELAPTDLVVGLAHASAAVVRDRGEAASDRLETAAFLFQAVAELRLALDEPVPLKADAVAEKIAELVSRSIMIGQVDMLMQTTKLGWLDKLADYEIDRARRRVGAETTNRKRADVRDRALSEAMRIVSTNPTLSHEDVALKVREALKLATSVKTMTDWVREWRRKAFLPERKLSNR